MNVNDVIQLGKEFEELQKTRNGVAATALIQNIRKNLTEDDYIFFTMYYYKNGAGGDKENKYAKDKDNPAYRVYKIIDEIKQVFTAALLDGHLLPVRNSKIATKAEGKFIRK